MADPKSQDNPYLAYISPSRLEDAQSPLFGFSFRKINGAQVRKAMNGDINPFTKQPYSGQYKESLKSRNKLPVYAQVDKFLNFFSENQIMIVMGETSLVSVVVIYKAILRENHPIIKIDGLSPQRLVHLNRTTPHRKNPLVWTQFFSLGPKYFCKCFFQCCRI
jgi:hypothetical protein